MIVLDASVVLDIVTGVPIGKDIVSRIAAMDDEFVAPEIMDLEVLQALRRQYRLERLTSDRANAAVRILEALPVERLSHRMLSARIWQLRDNATAYDAAYVALAEVMSAPLWTRYRKFHGVPGHAAQIVVI